MLLAYALFSWNSFGNPYDVGMSSQVLKGNSNLFSSLQESVTNAVPTSPSQIK